MRIPDFANDYASRNEFQRLNFHGIHIIRENSDIESFAAVFGISIYMSQLQIASHFLPSNFCAIWYIVEFI